MGSKDLKDSSNLTWSSKYRLFKDRNSRSKIPCSVSASLKEKPVILKAIRYPIQCLASFYQSIVAFATKTFK
jgi:hypothetical protein